MSRGRKLAVAAVAALVVVALVAPAAIGHTLTQIRKTSYSYNGQTGTYRHFTTFVPARERHTISCPRGYNLYPANLTVNRRDVHVKEHEYDDEEPPPLPPGQEDHRNEVGRLFEGHGARVRVRSTNFEAVPDPSRYDDQGPRYGRSAVLRAAGNRSSRMLVLCHKRTG